MKNTYHITTPIYYVNDVPHIGHAYTSVATDVIARFMRLSGKQVLFLTGTDEHGQKVEKSAIQCNSDPKTFVDKNSASFRLLMKEMNISNDDFIRTTDARHQDAVRIFWQKLLDNGAIYQGFYEGWYALRDEAYYDESELTAEGLAPTGAPVEWVKEPSYFFNLSKWQDKLLTFYDENPDFIRPIGRRNEVINFVKSGLHDLSVSRTTFNWGIKVPNNEKHVIYVWLDALVNYISALDYAGNGERYKKFWPANLHVVGKDILRFHAVYWPAFLMAAGLPLPRSIMAHGWWTNDGEKISKSLGNVIDPLKLIAEFGLDQVRYFLMREVTFGLDGNFSRESLINRVNSELSNKIGNLMQRTLMFVYKNNAAQIPSFNGLLSQIYKLPLLKRANEVAQSNIQLMANIEINNILENIINLVEEANSYIDKEAPWHLKNTDIDKMQLVLYTLMELLRYVAIMLQPFIPLAADQMLNQLNVPLEERMFKHLTEKYALVPGTTIPEPHSIFPRFSE